MHAAADARRGGTDHSGIAQVALHEKRLVTAEHRGEDAASLTRRRSRSIAAVERDAAADLAQRVAVVEGGRAMLAPRSPREAPYPDPLAASASATARRLTASVWTGRLRAGAADNLAVPLIVPLEIASGASAPEIIRLKVE